MIREDLQDFAERRVGWLKNLVKLPARIFEGMTFETWAVICSILFCALLLLILAAIITGNYGACRVNRLGDKANTAANKQENLAVERERIRIEANAELQFVTKEKEQSNENINKAFNNLGNARHERGNRNVGADELDRLARESR